MLSFSRVSNLPDDLPDWIRAEGSARKVAHFGSWPSMER